MPYEVQELQLEAGDSILFYSDGLVEAHSPSREMFGFPRLGALVAGHPGGAALIDFLLGQLASFTGADWEQEDDVTLVTLQRTALAPQAAAEPANGAAEVAAPEDWRTLATFTWPSEPGPRPISTRMAMSSSFMTAEAASSE